MNKKNVYGKKCKKVPNLNQHIFGVIDDTGSSSIWSRGMIPALGAGGPGFKLRKGPVLSSIVPTYVLYTIGMSDTTYLSSFSGLPAYFFHQGEKLLAY